MMKKQSTRFALLPVLLFSIFFLSDCKSGKTSADAAFTDSTSKISPNDPFKSSISESQYFNLDSKEDKVVEGNNGTVIVCPKGCFKNAHGEIAEGDVKIELSESLSLDEMILSNLTTTSTGQQLETDGMIYFNATQNGQQLYINKENPVHIEIPTKQKRQGMSVYKGLRDSSGNMNWVDPKPIKNYLVNIDMKLLDFLPEGFHTEVEKGMPFKRYRCATDELCDSLYYALSVSDGSELIKKLTNTNLNEAYYNDQAKMVNGKYIKGSYDVKKLQDSITPPTDTEREAGNYIDPAIIKVIRTKEYAHTLIATREFEERLKMIFKTCNPAVLKIYIKNTDKNLFELDSMAAAITLPTQYHHDFERFYLQKLTNVKNAGKYAALLEGYYEQQLSKIKDQLQTNKDKLVTMLDKKNAVAQKLADEYTELLWKREKYRMEVYGFDLTETGWINIDTGTLPKTWGPQRLEVLIADGKTYDRVYNYVVYTSIKSIYRMNTEDNALFYVGNEKNKEMLMPKRSQAFVMAIGYKGENAFLAIQKFETGATKLLTIPLAASTKAEIKKAIKAYDLYAQENRISVDMEYMLKFFIEQKRQTVLRNEFAFMQRLYGIAYPCRKADQLVITERR